MKRRKLIRHMEVYGCKFFREGKKHTVYYNPLNQKTSTVLRHTEINDILTMKICKDFEIPPLK